MYSQLRSEADKQVSEAHLCFVPYWILSHAFDVVSTSKMEVTRAGDHYRLFGPLSFPKRIESRIAQATPRCMRFIIVVSLFQLPIHVFYLESISKNLCRMSRTELVDDPHPHWYFNQLSPLEVS